ncbi:MepB family protein [Halobacteriovorax sp. ZH2_bin.1]|uniref:MepB family protein n=1 Tax=unclassified Halobacteriovorax TaxID=2639665 RepID=UPI003717C59C
MGRIFIGETDIKKVSEKLDSCIIHEEAQEYNGCSYTYEGKHYIQRCSKVTPKKVGQFVTLWKRDSGGKTIPYHSKDSLDYVVIICDTESEQGYFLFPKDALVKKGILSSAGKEGKRGFRLYPKWDQPTSKQAISSQKWQLDYFFTGTFQAIS